MQPWIGSWTPVIFFTWVVLLSLGCAGLTFVPAVRRRLGVDDMPDVVTLPADFELHPITPDERYALYGVIGDERHVLATAPDMASIGLAIGTIHEDQRSIGRRLADLGRIGVLDRMPDGKPSRRGEWIVQPYDRRPA